MASDIWLRTILIVIKETRCRHIGYSFRLTARVLLYAPSHRQDNTYHGLCYTSRGKFLRPVIKNVFFFTSSHYKELKNVTFYFQSSKILIFLPSMGLPRATYCLCDLVTSSNGAVLTGYLLVLLLKY